MYMDQTMARIRKEETHILQHTNPLGHLGDLFLILTLQFIQHGRVVALFLISYLGGRFTSHVTIDPIRSSMIHGSIVVVIRPTQMSWICTK